MDLRWSVQRLVTLRRAIIAVRLIVLGTPAVIVETHITIASIIRDGVSAAASAVSKMVG